MTTTRWNLVASSLHLLLVTSCGSATPPTNSSPVYPQVEVRPHKKIVQDIRPLHYNLSLLTVVDLKNPKGIFRGEVTIRLRVWIESRTIVLGVNGLKIGPKVWLIRRTTARRVTVKSLWKEVHQHTFGIDFNSRLWLGEEYELTVEFSGQMSSTNRGYFTEQYVDNNKRQWVTVTQLSPNMASSVFPCFDASYRTPFTLHLAHSREMQAVSNMPILRTAEHEDDNYVWTSFQETPSMTVQQLSFSINQFKVQDSPEARSDPLMKFWFRPAKAEHSAYAISLSTKLIDYFVDLFKLPYPMAKLDQLVLPDVGLHTLDYAGFVAHPESVFLYSEKHATAPSKQDVAAHLARKFSHHWFANLVDAGNFWLGEGLSGYLAGFAVDQVEPTWRHHETELATKTFAVLDEDSRASAQPVSFARGAGPMDYELQAYQKGSLLFRMLHFLVGTEVFTNSLRGFMKSSLKESSNQTLLWIYFQEESERALSLRQDIRVGPLMESWTLQPGYPLLHVRRNYDKREVTIYQKRFLCNPRGSATGQKPTNRQHCWYIPLTFTTAARNSWAHTLPTDWLTCSHVSPESPLTLIDVAEPNDWVVFNLRLGALCRINYDERNWQLLNEALMGENATQIDRFSRAQLLDDVLNLAGAGVVGYYLAFSFLRYLPRENESIVWNAVARNLEWLFRQLQTTPIIFVFKFNELFPSSEASKNNRTAADGSGPSNNSTGNSNSTSTDSTGSSNTTNDSNTTSTTQHTLKTIVLRLACETNLASCESLALRDFSQMNVTQNNIPVDQRRTIYCTAIRLGTEADWIELRKLFKSSEMSGERTMILEALSCSRDTWALEKMLMWAFGGANLAKVDVLRIFSAVVRNPVGYQLAKNYLIKNISNIKKFYSFFTDQIAALVSALVEKITTQSELDSIGEFMRNDLNDLVGIEHTSRRLLELGNDNIAWHKNNYISVVSAVCNLTGSMEPQCT
ncbi:aminopeptidase N isoform X2 [Drosophila bipectinata]|uniref:aminopeptidase N isoform X2 n=1 Tax=Drosophila bipectinata TaxID=42026 RepID=UPI0038B25269